MREAPNPTVHSPNGDTSMTITIESAGYIVCDNEVVWSVGTTADEAWDAMLKMMSDDETVVIDDTQYVSAKQHVTDKEIMENGTIAWVRASNFRIQSASAAFILQANNCDIAAWEDINGVACTYAEALAWFDAQEAEDKDEDEDA